MPWSINDVEGKKKGLSDSQKSKWVEIANAALEYYLKKGATRGEAERLAIMTANSKT